MWEDAVRRLNNSVMLKAHVVAHLMTEGVVSRSAIAQIELNAAESMSDYPRSLRLVRFGPRDRRQYRESCPADGFFSGWRSRPLGPPMNQIGKDFSFTVIEQRRH